MMMDYYNFQERFNHTHNLFGKVGNLIFLPQSHSPFFFWMNLLLPVCNNVIYKVNLAYQQSVYNSPTCKIDHFDE